MEQGSAIRIEFELREQDLDYFRERLKSAHEKYGSKSEDEIIAGAEALASAAKRDNVPSFVSPRLKRLRQMIDMLQDSDWRMEGEDRQHVLNALTYFAEPYDMIPDDIPGIGLLDDVIMIDLAVQELWPELQAYEEFCENRDELKEDSDLAEPLDVAREQLQSRMRRQRRRATRRAARRGGSGGTSYSIFRGT